jgi:hypothetical protein
LALSASFRSTSAESAMNWSSLVSISVSLLSSSVKRVLCSSVSSVSFWQIPRNQAASESWRAEGANEAHGTQYQVNFEHARPHEEHFFKGIDSAAHNQV